MSIESNKEIVRRFLAGRWDWDHLASLNECLAPSFVFHGPLGELQGALAFHNAMMAELEVVGNLVIQVNEAIAECGLVAARYSCSFDHRGDYMNIYPTGRMITYDAISLLRIEGGKIVEMWDEYDRLAMVQQMGGMQRLTDKDEKAIKEIVEDLHGIAFADNEVRANLIFAEDAELMPSHGPVVHGRKAISDWLEALPPLSDWKVADLKVDGAGNLAHVSGSYSVVVSPGGHEPFVDTGKYVQIWRRQDDGSWKIVKDIFNSDLPIPVRTRSDTSVHH